LKTKNLIFAFLSLIAIGFAGASELSADENNTAYNKFSFTLHGGALISYTDVNPRSFFNSASDGLTIGGGAGLNYHISPALSLQGRFLYGQLEGMQEKSNLQFQADIYEASINARISLNTLFNPLSSSNQWLNFYTTLGAGMLMHETELIDTQTGNVIRWPYQERDDVSLGDIHSAFVIPFGLGLNFNVSERIDIGIESTMGYVFTDELDARVVTGSRKDMYNYTSIGLTFRLGKNTRSQDWAPANVIMYPGDREKLIALNDQVTSAETNIDATASEVDQVKSDVERLSAGQTEINKQNAQIYGALEDLAERLLSYEAIIEQETEKPTEQQPDSFFTVQLMAHKEDISIEEVRTNLKTDLVIEKIFVDGWYKFYSGRYNNLEDAKLHMMRIWGQGIKDAFIVEYENGTLTPR
jgi:hypothetical protein